MLPPKPEDIPDFTAKTSRLAIAGVSLGSAGALLFVVGSFCDWPNYNVFLILGVPAGICAVLARRKIKEGYAHGQKVVMASIATAIICMSFLGLRQAGYFSPSMWQFNESTRRVNCTENLRAIGEALANYAKANQRQYPKDLGALVDKGFISADSVFLCPSSRSSKKIDRVTVDLIRHGRLGYLYFGKGKWNNDKNASTTVILCDKPGNHGNRWINCLFIDGNVKGIKAKSLRDAAIKTGWVFPTLDD